jgi:DNA-binding GntR family transcriptional regulator
VLTLDDSRPTYLQVADVLRAEITGGQLPPGERLASVRDLATRFDVAAVTVQSALRVLRDEGLVVARSTRGYFVRDELPDPTPEGGTAEYVALRRQLDAIETLIRDLADRVSHLEAVVAAEEAAARPDSSPPAAGADEPDLRPPR